MNTQARTGVIVDVKSLDDGQILYKVRVPTLHGNKVKDEDLPFIPASYTPGLAPSKTSYGAFDKGQWVEVTQKIGEFDSGYGTITGIYQNPVATPELQGNASLANLWRGYLDKAREKVKQVKEITKTTDNGVEVYDVTTEIDHKLSNAMGFSSNEGLGLLLSVNIPAITNLSTAINQFEQVFNTAESMLGNLQGNLFSLGNLSSLLSSSGLMDQLTKFMPKEVVDALNTILSQSVTVSGDPRSQSVNLDVFLPNLVTALQDVKTIGQLTQALDDTMNDPTQFGLDQLENIVSQVEGAFGASTQTVDQFGNIIHEITDAVQSIINSFSGLVSSVSAVDSHLWSTEDQMTDMIQSLKTETAVKIRTMISGLPK